MYTTMTTKASASASRSKQKPWQPAALEPEFSPQVAELLLTEDGRRQLSSLLRCRDQSVRIRVKRHLVALGWTILSRPNAAMLTRFRYVAPPGPGHAAAKKSYYSLPDLVVEFGQQQQQQQEEEEDGQVIQPLAAAPLLPPPETTKTNSIASGDREDDDDDDDDVPEPSEEEDEQQQQQQQDVIGEYIAMMKTNDRARGSSACRLRDSAKSHLQACGWTFWMKLKNNGREELRYRAPTGRSYISLHTACQAFINTTRPSRQIVVFGGGGGEASNSNSNSKSSGKMDRRRVHPASPATILRALRPGAKKRKLSELMGDDAVNVTVKKCRTTVKKNGAQTQTQLMKKSITLTRDRDRDRDRDREKKKNKGGSVLLRPSNNNQQQQQQQRSRTLLSVLIDRDILVPRDKVSTSDGPAAKHGFITGEGMIRCTCGCNDAFTVAEFEAHATATARRGTTTSCRDAWARVFLRDGRPLSRCLEELMARDDNESMSMSNVRVKARCSDPEGDSVCSICNDGGDLLLCDSCPSAFHHACVGLQEQDTPDGDWFCPSCRCGLCGATDFDFDHRHHTTGRFTDKTIIYCEQCEREYHVGCVRGGEAGAPAEEWWQRQDDDDEEEEAPWLCGPECSKVFRHLQGLAAAATPIPTAAQGVSLRILRRRRRPISSAAAAAEHGALCAALDVLHECFVTLVEPRTQTDLAADMVFSRESELRRLNFRGYYVVGLEKAGELVTVGTLRVHGAQLAELPLVGTRFAHRRQGMCHLLLTELEKTLRHAGVRSLVLPAVPELLPMWTASLGFQPMAHSDVTEIAKEHAILTFQGTTMCQKTLPA